MALWHTSVRLLDEDRLDHPLIARRVKRHAHQDPSDGDPRLVGRAADGELLVRLALAEERQIALPPVLGPVEERLVPVRKKTSLVSRCALLLLGAYGGERGRRSRLPRL